MTDPVAIVTGASRGIGQHIARTLAARGAQVVAAARDNQGLTDTCTRIERAGGCCRSVTVDVSTYAGACRAVQGAVAAFGRVDVLVNNAGCAPLYRMEDYDVAAFDRMMAVNCHAVFYLTRAVWPLFQKQGGGRIVNISSMAATDPFPGFQAYGAAKAWVNLFTRALADEGREHGISVFGVAPGAVDTTMLRQHFPDFPTEQCLSPEQVADAVAWILEPAAGIASGSVVCVRR